MSEFSPAFTFMMRHEDATLSGKVAEDNNGARVRYGLNEAANPSLTPEGFYTIPAGEALELAKLRYISAYWLPANLAPILEQRVASKIFDACVNMGIERAIKIAQYAANEVGVPSPELISDGVCGLHTTMALNRCDPMLLLEKLCDLMWQFHQSLMLRDPHRYPRSLGPGWKARDFDLPPTFGL